VTKEHSRLYYQGRLDPETGGVPLRSPAGHKADETRVLDAARSLGRQVYEIAPDDYECEIIAAAKHPNLDAIGYVESRARQVGENIDVTFGVNIRQDGSNRRWELQSYNPYFGVDVSYLEWWGNALVLIYREKHDTYVCSASHSTEAQFAKIEDVWTIDNQCLSYRRYNDSNIRSLSLPDLTPLPTVADSRAKDRVGDLAGE
jgi:hypothetical protein